MGKAKEKERREGKEKVKGEEVTRGLRRTQEKSVGIPEKEPKTILPKSEEGDSKEWSWGKEKGGQRASLFV
jgi:hypothetical protein